MLQPVCFGRETHENSENDPNTSSAEALGLQQQQEVPTVRITLTTHNVCELQHEQYRLTEVERVSVGAPL